MIINKDLKEYIATHIFPRYDYNDMGHGIDHIFYVIDRSLKFAKEIPDINYNMVFTIAAYHDVGHSIDAKNHEKISGDILFSDKNLRRFFSPKDINTMKEAIYDHRASNKEEPRNIYGKIVSSADRNTSVDSAILRTYYYILEHAKDRQLDDTIESSRIHLIRKFGSEGYAQKKSYFDDPEYQKFLKELAALTEDKDKFRERYLEVIGVKEKILK
jgi:uncharacterized protein